MPARCLAFVRQGLIAVEHRQDRLRDRVPVPGDQSRLADFVAYADHLFDARTSTLATVDGSVFGEDSLSLLRPLGAPVVAQCHSDHVVFWKQTEREPKFIKRVEVGKIASFFQAHREELAPTALYRAKVSRARGLPAGRAPGRPRHGRAWHSCAGAHAASPARRGPPWPPPPARRAAH